MDDLFRAIITKNKIYYDIETDSHEDILEKNNISDINEDHKFIRAKLVSKTDIFDKNPDNWEFILDQDFEPQWYNKTLVEKRLKKFFFENIMDIYILQDTEIKEVRDKYLYAIKNVNIGTLINSTVNNMQGNSTVKDMQGNSTVKDMYGNSTVKGMYDNSTVNSMQGNSTIGRMYSNSTVNNMCVNSTVKDIYENSIVERMFGNSIVERMFDNSTVNNMCGKSTVKGMYDNSIVGYMCDNSAVEGIHDNSKVNNMKGNSTVNNKKN